MNCLHSLIIITCTFSTFYLGLVFTRPVALVNLLSMPPVEYSGYSPRLCLWDVRASRTLHLPPSPIQTKTHRISVCSLNPPILCTRLPASCPQTVKLPLRLRPGESSNTYTFHITSLIQPQFKPRGFKSHTLLKLRMGACSVLIWP